MARKTQAYNDNKILTFLSEHKGEAYPPRYICMLVGLSYGTTTITLSNLVAEGKIQCKPCPSDFQGYKRGKWYYVPIDAE